MNERSRRINRWPQEVGRLVSAGAVIFPIDFEMGQHIASGRKTLEARGVENQYGQIDTRVARITVGSLIHFFNQRVGLLSRYVTQIYEFPNLEALAQSELDFAQLDPARTKEESLVRAPHFVHPRKPIKVFELVEEMPQV